MKADHSRALDILKSRDSKWTVVRLHGGDVCRVHSIAWGYDLGDEIAHITTNTNLESSESHTIDFFYANQIAEINDDESGELLFKSEQ